MPLVTLPGEKMASRVAASLLNTVGLPQLVARSFPEYEEIAVRLATHPSMLADIRARLEACRTSSTLFDTQRWVMNFERAILAMWARRGGHSREPIVVHDCVDGNRLSPVRTIAEDVYDRPKLPEHGQATMLGDGSSAPARATGSMPGYGWVQGAPMLHGIGRGKSELELPDAEDVVTEHLRHFPPPRRPSAKDIAITALA